MEWGDFPMRSGAEGLSAAEVHSTENPIRRRATAAMADVFFASNAEGPVDENVQRLVLVRYRREPSRVALLKTAKTGQVTNLPPPRGSLFGALRLVFCYAMGTTPAFDDPEVSGRFTYEKTRGGGTEFLCRMTSVGLGHAIVVGRTPEDFGELTPSEIETIEVLLRSEVEQVASNGEGIQGDYGVRPA